MPSKTSLLDLDRTAAAAAAPLQGKDKLTQLQGQLAAFESAGHDARDFDQWSQYFGAHIAQDANLAQRPAPSAIADSVAGSAVAAPAAAVAPAAASPKPFVQPAAAPAASLVKLILLFALFAFSAVRSQAQIFGSPLVVTGLVSAPILTSYAPTSNSVAIPVAQHTLMLTNIQTGFNYVVSYGALLVGQSGSNFVTQASFTTNFSNANGWTNGMTWIYVVPNQYLYPSATPWGSVQCPAAATGVLFE